MIIINKLNINDYLNIILNSEYVILLSEDDLLYYVNNNWNIFIEQYHHKLIGLIIYKYTGENEVYIDQFINIDKRSTVFNIFKYFYDNNIKSWSYRSGKTVYYSVKKNLSLYLAFKKNHILSKTMMHQSNNIFYNASSEYIRYRKYNNYNLFINSDINLNTYYKFKGNYFLDNILLDSIIEIYYNRYIVDLMVIKYKINNQINMIILYPNKDYILYTNDSKIIYNNKLLSIKHDIDLKNYNITDKYKKLDIDNFLNSFNNEYYLSSCYNDYMIFNSNNHIINPLFSIYNNNKSKINIMVGLKLFSIKYNINIDDLFHNLMIKYKLSYKIISTFISKFRI